MPPIDLLVLPDTSGEALLAVRERSHGPPHGVLPSIQLRQNPASIVVIVNIAEQVERFRNTPDFSNRTSERGGATSCLQRSHDIGRVNRSYFEGACDTKHIIPMICNQITIWPHYINLGKTYAKDIALSKQEQ